MAKSCDTPFGVYSLDRWPLLDNDKNQAWDQADLLLLKFLKERETEPPVLVLNDRFGALATALHTLSPVTWSDSFLSRRAAEHNLGRNELPELQFVDAAQSPKGEFSIVAARLPKSMPFWRSQLVALRSVLSEGSIVVVASMNKHLPASALEIMRQTLGPSQRQRAVGKARLLVGEFDPELTTQTVADPVLAFEGLEFQNLPNVFSRSKIDKGSRLFLETVSESEQPRNILDLGCGNGLLGVVLQQKNPRATLTYLDESYQAVASARINHSRNCPTKATFVMGEGLTDYKGPKFDLIALNPPFHQGHEVGDSVAWRMFQQCRQHLLPGGELRVVGNRHLGYHAKLKRLYGNCQLLASNRQFVVLSAKLPST